MSASTFGFAKDDTTTIGPMHLLLIEDDLDLGSGLQAAFRLEGFACTWLRRVADAPHSLEDTGIDCAVLDLSLPDGDGAVLLARWRGRGGAVPVIVVTARTALEDRLRHLDGGADDFVVKPFATAELLSRIRAVTRRSAGQASERWTIGALTIEPRARAAWLHDQALALSPREFQLLHELAREPGAVVTKARLATRLEPLGEPLDFAAIEVHVSNLRRKIGAARIRTVRGVGYLLER
jgi:two-component system response regulator BasR